jgi:hypothetical protein
METDEILLNFYQATSHHVSEDRSLHILRRKILKYHIQWNLDLVPHSLRFSSFSLQLQ